MKEMYDQNVSGHFSNMTYNGNYLPRIDAEKGFDVHEAVLKANARTKKWITYSVVVGSVIVLTLAGIMVGLYLSGNLKQQDDKLPVVNEGALAGRGDALTGGSMAGGAGKKSLDGNIKTLGGLVPTTAPPVQSNIDPALVLAASGSDVLDNVQDAVSDIAENVQEAVSNVADTATDLTENVMDVAEDIMDNTAGERFDGLDTLSEMTDTFEDIVENMAENRETLSESMASGVEDLVENIRENIEDVLENTEEPNEMIEELTDNVEDLIEDLTENDGLEMDDLFHNDQDERDDDDSDDDNDDNDNWKDNDTDENKDDNDEDDSDENDDDDDDDDDNDDDDDDDDDDDEDDDDDDGDDGDDDEDDSDDEDSDDDDSKDNSNERDDSDSNDDDSEHIDDMFEDISDDLFDDSPLFDDVESRSRDHEPSTDTESELFDREFLSDRFDFSNDADDDEERSTVFRDSDINNGIRNMASDFIDRDLPEIGNTDRISFDIGERFNFDSPLSGLSERISETTEHVRDITNIDGFGFQDSNFDLEFNNPLSRIGDFVSDFSQSFEDRPAPDFSVPEFSLDSSILSENRNDNFENSWLRGDSMFDRSDSLFSEGSSDSLFEF